MGVLLDSGKFSWADWTDDPLSEEQTISDWLKQFEQDHWDRTKRTEAALFTWKKDYQATFSRLERERTLTLESLLDAARTTEPDSRTRKRVCVYLHKLAKFANLEGREKIQELAGNYSAAAVQPQKLPSDKLIAEYRNSIESDAWRWVFGMIATYGLAIANTKGNTYSKE